MLKNYELFNLCNEENKHMEFGYGKKLCNVCIGDIWWYYEGINIRQEMGTKSKSMQRPCIIVKVIKKTGLIWVLPISSKIHQDSSYMIPLKNWKSYGLKKPSAIFTYQIRCIDKKRLIDKCQGKRASKGLLKLINYEQQKTPA